MSFRCPINFNFYINGLTCSLLNRILNSNFFQNSLKYFFFSIVSDEHVLVEISRKQICRCTMQMAHRILKHVRVFLTTKKLIFKRPS
jgi:hypothetical protein